MLWDSGIDVGNVIVEEKWNVLRMDCWGGLGQIQRGLKVRLANRPSERYSSQAALAQCFSNTDCDEG